MFIDRRLGWVMLYCEGFDLFRFISYVSFHHYMFGEGFKVQTALHEF